MVMFHTLTSELVVALLILFGLKLPQFNVSLFTYSYLDPLKGKTLYLHQHAVLMVKHPLILPISHHINSGFLTFFLPFFYINIKIL